MSGYTPRTRAYLQGSEYEDGQFQGISAQDLRDGIGTMLGPPITLTPSAGAVTWPLATAPIATVTLTANTTITVTGGEDGMTGYSLVIIQGGAGSLVPTFSGATLFPTAPVWATAVGAYNRVYVHSFLVGATLNIAADVI